jgi:hypothetical protein
VVRSIARPLSITGNAWIWEKAIKEGCDFRFNN